MPRQSSRRKPSRCAWSRPESRTRDAPSCASQPDPSAPQRPNANATIRDPSRFAANSGRIAQGLVGRLRAEIADVVVGRAEPRRAGRGRRAPAATNVTGASSPQIAAARSGTSRVWQNLELELPGGVKVQTRPTAAAQPAIGEEFNSPPGTILYRPCGQGARHSVAPHPCIHAVFSVVRVRSYRSHGISLPA